MFLEDKKIDKDYLQFFAKEEEIIKVYLESSVCGNLYNDSDIESVKKNKKEKNTEKRIKLLEDMKIYSSSLIKLIKENRREYEPYISNLIWIEVNAMGKRKPNNEMSGIFSELKKINPIIIEKTKPHINIQDVELLVSNYLKNDILRSKDRNDLQHIAIATIFEIDSIVSWNHNHFLDPRVMKKVNIVNKENGYNYVSIRTPEDIVKLAELKESADLFQYIWDIREESYNKYLEFGQDFEKYNLWIQNNAENIQKEQGFTDENGAFDSKPKIRGIFFQSE